MTKFFTNEGSDTLIDKIQGIFHYRNIHFFDALVGYFRASGYFRIRPFIEKAAEIRILVGINVNNLILEATKQGLLFEVDVLKSQEDFFKEIKKSIQQAAYSKNVEDGMLQLIKDLASRKVQIRVHPKQNIHAKVYVFREKDKHDHGYGAVITGSSNLTEAGLERNFEFNVELRENADIEFATQTFDRLWLEGIPIADEFVDRLKKETFLNDHFTPYEIYLKFLIEYFGKSIDFDPNSVTDLPKGFKRLSYQIDAVNDGFNKMERHGGFFLADVVGLGKTIVATIIAKKYYFKNGFPEHRSHTLIVVPPALKDNWRETAENFGLENYEIVTNGSLHKISNPDKYDLVIVDEAHKFRSDTADAYNGLQKICKSGARRRLPDGTRAHKKVMLISATPLNNRPEDIANLVYLFQDSKDSTLEIGNLQHFFRQHIEAYRKAQQETDIAKVKEMVKRIYDQIRVKVIEPLTVRRTRTDLLLHEQYSKDLAAQGIRFPNVQKPEKLFYKLNPNLEDLYDRTIYYLGGSRSDSLTYNRYRAIGALKPPKKIKYKKADMISSQLAKIMKTMLVKRLDSSFFAFTQSLKRFCNATEAMVTMFDQGRIFIAPNLPVTEFINNDQEDELLDLVLERMEFDTTIEICIPDDFEPDFYSGLLHDQQILRELVAAWAALGDEDPKLDTFVHYLRHHLFNGINHEGKLVVFSESKETTDYLARRLPQFIDQRILTVDSKTRKDRMPTIRANFDANYPDAQRRHDYDIVISTEVLAEGVNLHRANIIVNYDTPWNSTRLMQRIGRVNRIGSQGDQVHIFNFFPTAQVDSDIDLQKKALMKLQAFHAALGEDSQIYTPDEETSTFGLFDKDLDEERDEKLDYLMKIRAIKEKEPELFKRIKNMPLRARVGRKSRILREATISFIRNEKRDAFVFVKPDGSIEDLTFLETAKQFEARADEKPVHLHDLHHHQVQTAIVHFENALEQEKAKDRKVDVTQGPNEKKAITFLDSFMGLSFINEMEKELVGLSKEAIRKGRFQNLQRDINKLQKSQKTAKHKLVVLLDELMKVLNSYPLRKSENDEEAITSPVVIIPSEAFAPQIIISESFSA